jgi:hypothetical protein
MKYTYSIVLLAAVLGASAQVSSYNPLSFTQPNQGDGPQYTTVDVYESCTDTAVGTDTITSTVVETTCPLCTNTPTTPPSGLSGSMVRTTVYTTVYQTLCSTGLTDQTYTVTETCTGATPTWPSSMGPSYMPPGFTQTVTVCTVCNNQASPTTVTMTVCTVCDGGGGALPPTTTTGPLKPPPTFEPSNTGAGGLHSGTTTTTTVCPGSTLCHHTTSTTSTTTSRSSVSPYTAGAMHTAGVWAHVLGGAIAAAGAVLI